MTTETSRPLSILVCALGGEGGGVLAEWIVQTATRCGHAAQSTSIPGVAQRTGATTYYLEIARAPSAGLAEAPPVFSLYAVPGALDLLIASEPLEAARQVAAGFVTPERTRVITSSQRTLTTHEKMQLADGRVDPEQLVALLRDYSRRRDAFEMSTMAQQARTALSAIMLGALAGSGELPFPRAAFEETIRRFGRGTQASLAGFARGYAQLAGAGDSSSEGSKTVSCAPAARFGDASFPSAIRPLFALGYARLVDYQDARYADLYRERVERVLATERTVDPTGVQGFAATREAARHLASWMAYDDVVRVADLKSRASRIARVRSEVKASPRDVLRVYDHFKPGVPELAGLLPARIAEALKRRERARVARGREPLAWPLKLPVHAISGLAVLRLIASLKRFRRHGSRFAAEQSMIERWLIAIERGMREGWRVGHEIALCGRLVKGYGATNERAKENLLHVIDHLAVAGTFVDAASRADAIRAAREAALADDAGKALDMTLERHGIPPRPVKPQPIRFVRSRSAQPARKIA
jgi:indolepyruvate ferredoxin oxidoreductase, beta subunit